MLQWTAAGDGARFMGIVRHTDGEREWAYDRQSSIGRLDKALDEAMQKGWTVVDMKQDWKVIYPFRSRQRTWLQATEASTAPDRGRTSRAESSATVSRVA